MRVFLTSLTLAVAAALAGCDASTATTSPKVAELAADPVAASAKGHGFVTGNPVARQTVYVYFDAQCPHCGHLWESMKGLSRQVRVVWIPVALLNNASVSQGAAILASANPAETMEAHEKSLAATHRGMNAPYPDDAARKLMQENTRLWESMGEQGVPLIVSKDASGKLVKKAAALQENELRALLGVPLA